MGSPPLGAEERVVIVGGGIGEKGLVDEGLDLSVARRVAARNMCKFCGGSPPRLIKMYEAAYSTVVQALLRFAAVGRYW